MALWVPQHGVVRVQHNLTGIGTVAPGTAVTTGGSSSTKGSAVQLIASTSFDAFEIIIMVSNYAASAITSKACLDIMVGAATEEVIIPDLLAGHAGMTTAAVNQGPKHWKFPLYIPAGSRISARAAGSRTGTDMRVCVFIRGGNVSPPFRVGSKVVTYGIGTVPAGTPVTHGNASEGAWTQVTASTSEYHWACLPSFQGPTDTTLTPLRTFELDIGIGAATEELLGGYEQGYMYRVDTLESIGGPYNYYEPVFADIPASSRLTARLSADGGADAAAYEVALHCVS